MFFRLKYLRATRQIRERLSGENNKGTYVILQIGTMLQKWDQCANSKTSSFHLKIQLESPITVPSHNVTCIIYINIKTLALYRQKHTSVNMATGGGRLPTSFMIEDM